MLNAEHWSIELKLKRKSAEKNENKKTNPALSIPNPYAIVMLPYLIIRKNLSSASF